MKGDSIWTRLFSGKKTHHASKFRPSVEGLENRLTPTVGSISGHVYLDATGNGLTSDDSAQGGLTVRVYRDTNHNGVLDGNDPRSAQQVSNGTGGYNFTGLSPDTYFVNESVPSNFIRTAPTPSSYYTVHLGSGQAAAGGDFDNFQLLNKNVVTNISFTVTRPNGTQATFTDLRGHTHQGDTVTANFTIAANAGPTVVSFVSYDAPASSFDANTAGQQTVDVTVSGTFGPGPHSLSLVVPSNFYQVDFILGAAIDHFGPAGGNIFYSAQSRLLSADNGGTQAFAESSLSGSVLSDDGNGNTTAFVGVTVTLTGVNDLGQQVTLTTQTDTNGDYTFGDLRSGTYTLTVQTPSDNFDGSASAGTGAANDGSATPGTIANIVLTNGNSGVNFDFVEVLTDNQGPPQT